MLIKPETCSLCVLFTKGQGFVPDDIPDKADVVFVGEAPGGTEVELGKPFEGKAGFVLWNWMVLPVPQLWLAKEKGRVGRANTLRCLPPEKAGRAYPSGQEKEDAERCCSQYDNLKQAHTVVLLGEHAQRKFFSSELAAEDATDRALGHEVKGVSGRMGRVYERDGRRYVFAPHPAWVLRQPSLVQAAQESLKIAANVDKLVQVNYTPWSQAMEALR